MRHRSPIFSVAGLIGAAVFAAISSASEISAIEKQAQNGKSALIRVAAACDPNCARAVVHNEGAPPTSVPPNDAFQRTLDQANVKRGRIEIALFWEGTTDLDLHVLCPGGEIYFSNRTKCSAQFDQDANATGIMEHPIEHIVWTDSMPPPGDYHVAVVAFRFRGQDRPGSLHYTVRMTYRFDDGKLVLLKEVKDKAAVEEKERDEVFSFTSPINVPPHP